MFFPQIDGEEFVNEDFVKQALRKGEYEDCRFLQCNFEGVDLSAYRFIDCVFESCNWSNVQVRGTSLQSVVFRNSKLLGLQFNELNPLLFSVDFYDSVLNYSSFYQVQLPKASFLACDLKEVDFSEANLTAANFEGADLQAAIFERTNLSGADLREAKNLLLDPELNRLKGAKLKLAALPGLLAKYELEVEL